MSTQTLTLTEFLLARIAEDEASARAASPGPWMAFRAHDRNHAQPDWIGVTRDMGVDYDPDVFSSQRCGVGDAEHIARHDPARVLAECEAKRQIMGAVERALPRGTNGLGPGVLRHLAAIYADHPDYREEWRP